ncbi:hypothetical protein LTR56_017126 [Elasticomyces elasticus]|nr:hypothetical protein LTR22_021804 [Elasticomyces elasticus]KAK3630981.1 hypothetical protein LTR56_017126 [Elasticomyces elasticus]KAK4908794.1 hypothetical protein LTR49_022360 [Elasticomyces elasticus]KAK5748796.1 hypothetical protein LTS12_021147 [Elasticomyces elasticus]
MTTVPSSELNDPAQAGCETEDPTTTTLRNSCDKCATSKIRCTKEKPECSRCLKRNVACSYSVPRRSGRPALHGQQGATKKNTTRRKASLVTGTSTAGHSSTGSSTTTSRSPTTSSPTTPGRTTDLAWENLDWTTDVAMQATTNISSNGSPAMNGLSSSASQEVLCPSSFSQIFTSLLPAPRGPWTNVPAPTQVEMDELFNLGGLDHNNDFAALNMGGFPNDAGFAQSDFFAPFYTVDQQSQYNPSTLTQTNQPAFPLLPTPSDSSTSSGNLDSYVDLSSYFSGDPVAIGGSRMSGSSSRSSSALHNSPNLRPSGSCSCHGRALDLVGQPTPLQNHNNGLSNGRPSFESVIDLNNTATDAMSEILQCPCGKDAYLLIVLALAAFKTLEWFDAAAADGEAGLVSAPNTSIGGVMVGRENPSRAAAQIVFSRLPSIHRVVRALSDQLLTLHGNANLDDVNTPQQHTSNTGGSGDDCFALSTLSSSLTNSLEGDLRKRTIDLAKRVIVRLR